VAVESSILGERFANAGQLGFLGVTFHRDVAALPCGFALLQGNVVERATAPQDKLELALLFGRRPEFLFEGLTHGIHGLPPGNHSTRHARKRLKPGKARLTAWVQTLRLAAGSFCQTQAPQRMYGEKECTVNVIRQ
jgi:hypothetical protein